MLQLNRRDVLRYGLLGGTAAVWPVSMAKAAGANDEIRVGFISCGSRAGGHMGAFSKIPGVRVTGLCDPDEGRLASARERFPQAKGWKDLRGLLDDDQIDAVVVATCNHWHCLASIWAMQAGKDVYVEKPLSHSQWEGSQVVAATKKYGRICQVGTQQRSDPMQAEIKTFLHNDRSIGSLVSARVNRYGIRAPIGRRSTPLEIPGSVDYDLWLGPAQRQPIYRDKLQYDWHWDWNTGSGEMGNWGVHVLDDMRNNVLQDKVNLPNGIAGGGGRLVWDDAGQTPNVHFVYFDTGIVPVIIGLSNLPEKPGSKKSFAHPGPGSGYVVYCEGGRLEGQRGRAAAYDVQGKLIRNFKGDAGKVHQRNFIDAVRAHDASLLNSPIDMGHYSTGWCNLANIAFRAGRSFSAREANELASDSPDWRPMLADMATGLKQQGVALDDRRARMSPLLKFDPEREQFVGEHAAGANAFLKRKYRKPYEVPEIAAG